MAPRMKNTGPGCCCDDGDCIIFADVFEGSELANYYDISGTMTIDTGSDLATISSGSIIGPLVNQPSGSGMFYIDLMSDRTKDLTIRFNYADSSNYWRIELTAAVADSGGSDFAHGHIFFNTWKMSVYEVVAGSEEYIGSRHIPFNSTWEGAPSPQRLSLTFCWHEGGRVVITPSHGQEVIWPNSVTGGNSFRIEPDDDLDVYELSWFYNRIEHPELGDYAPISNPTGCPCGTYNCLTCEGEWGDTMEIIFTSGPYSGDGVVVDRNRDYPAADDGRAYGYSLNYWQFYYVAEHDFFGPADPDGHDWDAILDFCEGNTSGGSDRTTGGRLRMTHYGAAPNVDGDELFDTDDCEGPYTTTMDNSAGGTVDVEITPSAP